jgi:hypothetical protein
MRRKHIKGSVLLTVVVLAFTTILFAQNGVMVIGTIVHSDSAPAVNVYVSIAGVGSYTDVRGKYRLDGVPPGPQRMRVEYPRGVLLDKPVEVTVPMAHIDQMVP